MYESEMLPYELKALYAIVYNPKLTININILNFVISKTAVFCAQAYVECVF